MSAARGWLRTTAWLLVAIVCFSSAFAMAAETDDDALPPLRFRRIYASAEAIAAWPRPNERYLPVEPAEFERLVEQARAEDTSVPPAPIAQARYAARLDGASLVDGTAELTWNPADALPPLVAVTPLGVAVERATWSDGEPAALGQRPDGEVTVVSRPNLALKIDWSLRGHRDSTGALKFDLVLPRTLEASLELDLPHNLTPVFEHGIVTRPRKIADRMTWSVALGAHHRTSIRLVPSDAVSMRRRLPLARTLTTYRFSPRGLDVSSEIRLDVQHDPIRKLALLLDPGVRVVSARFGDTPLTWSIEADKHGDTVVVDLGEPWQGAGRVLRLEALAPFEAGTMFTLPRLQVQGVNWQEGSMTLLVPAPLMIQQLVPVLARQSKIGPLPTPSVGESLEMQCFAADATAEVTVARHSEPLHLALGSTIEMSRGRASAELVAECRVETGDRFTLLADVADRWLIDSVSTQPESVLGDWSVTAVEGQPRRLALQLTRALSSDRPVRVIVRTHASLPPDRPLLADDFSILRFHGAQVDTDLLGLTAGEGYRVRLDVRDPLPTLRPTDLSDEQRKLFATAPPELILPHEPADVRWDVSLEPLAPLIEAEIETSATVEGDQLIESYRVRCTPLSGNLGRLHVHFSEARSEPLVWHFDPEHRGKISVQEIAAGEPTAEWSADGKTWEIRFRQPSDRSVEFRASRVSPLGEQAEVNLISVAEALEQRGRVVIRAAGDVPLTITDEGLTPVALPATTDDGPPLRAAFQYTSDRDTVSSLQSITLTRPSVMYPHGGAIAWSAETDSRYDPDGRGTHRTTLRIENEGRPHLIATLEHGEFTRAWIDDQRVSLSGQRAEMALPRGQRFPRIVLEYVTTDDPLDGLSSRVVGRPNVDVPLIAQRHTLWLPPGYELADGGMGDTDGGWLRRWFGPLERRSGEPIFDPTAPAETLSLDLDDAPENIKTITAAVLESLGRRSNSKSNTWGGLLREVESSARAEWPPLRIDGVALDALEVTPNSSLPKLRADRPLPARQMAIMRLERAGLALIVSPTSVVLTSREFATLRNDELDELDSLTVYYLRPGPLATRFEQPSAGDPRMLSVATWQGETDEPWTDEPIDDALVPVGWSGSLLARSTAGETLHIVRAANIHVGGWATFLLMAVVGTWKLRDRNLWLGELAVVFAIVALLLPAYLAPWASGALLGTLFARLSTWLAPHALTLRPATSVAPVASTITRAISLPLIVLAVLLGAEHLVRGAAADTAPRAYWVFIPCDDQGKPTGQRYQVPAQLDAELRRRAQLDDAPKTGWLVLGADYDIVLMHDAMHGLSVSDVTARFDVQTFRDHTTVQIPWEMGELEAIPDAAVVDGRFMPLEYLDGKLCGTVADAGRARWEIPLRLRRSTSGGEPAVSLAIPRLVTARLDVHVPTDAPDIEIVGALGATTHSTNDQTLKADLGPTDRFTVRWAAARDDQGTAEVEELYWLQVRPGSATVNAKLKIRGLPPQSRRLRLAVDPRLRLLPVGQNQPVIDVITLPGNPATLGDAREVQLVIGEQAGADFELSLSFLMTNTSGVGNVRLPRLDVLGMHSTRRWLGVSVDSALESEVLGGETFEPVDAPAFLSSWNEAVPPPGGAFELPRGATNWTLAIHPRQARTAAQQQLVITAAPSVVAVEYNAQLTTTDGYCFQHRLLAPQELTIDSVSVLADGVQRMARWTQEPNGKIVVFLNAPVTGLQELALRGKLPVPADGKLSLPIVRLADEPLSGANIDVYRQASARVSLSDERSLVPQADAPLAQRVAQHTSLVASLRADGDDSAAVLTVEPNHVRASVVQVASLKRDAQNWLAEVDMLWTVAEGSLDVLRLEIPDDWTGPFTIAPAPAATEIVELPGQKRHLLIYPRTSIDSTFRVSVTGPVGSDNGQTVRMTHVAPIGATVEAYVKLPTHAGLQRVDWETSQLRPAALPAEFTTSSVVEAAETFRVIGPDPVARLQRVERVSDIQRVRLADVRWAWQGGATYVAWAGLDLEPAGATNCVVELPGGTDLLETRVDGQIATAESLGDGQWRIQLRLRQLPQRVELLYRGAVKPSSWSSLKLRAPRIQSAPAEKVLWTLYGATLTGGRSNVAGQRLDSVGAELTRLAALTMQVDLPLDDVSAHKTDELLPWFGERRAAWLATRDRVRRWIASSSSSSESAAVTIELARLEQEFEQIAARLMLTASDEPAASVPMSQGRLWDDAFADQSLASHLLCTGADVDASVRLEGDSDLAGRWGAAVLIAGLAIGLHFARERVAPAWGFLERWPQLVGVAIGLFWWLWLAPSVVGLVIALVSIAAGWRPALTQVREGSGGIVRLASRLR